MSIYTTAHKAIPYILGAISLLCQAQPQRQLQYQPTADGAIVCHNGNNRYTRALYGGESSWRLETSDMPIFGAYHNKDNRNIHFVVETPKGRIRLDSVADCTATYRGGVRTYQTQDPAWGKGTMTITVVACHDSEAAIWRVEGTGMPKGSTVTAYTCPTAIEKFHRSGDLGADVPDCFAPAPDKAALNQCTIGIAGKSAVKYIKYQDRDLTADGQATLEKEYIRAKDYQQALTSKLIIDTPDPYINTLGASIMAAADGIWDGTTYQHGAVGWRIPLSGWRGAYTGDFLGQHDRARTHFDAYATSQVTDIPPVYPHPTPDSTLNLARAEKRWGTQMYSNGYICRNPGRNDQMHHYDMNLCYIDELLWHIKWTGDIDYARKMWPTIKSSLEWEKRNYDPDDNGLYDAYCCIWASDALYYNGGAVTHSSAYNHRANKIAAEIASCIGEDPTPYATEAAKILNAINSTLWLEDRGVWAEYKDCMGNRLTHDHPGVWTIYHAIDGDVASPQQAYSATGYIIDNIPHIPVTAPGLDRDDYATISTTDWLPYSWSINNVAHAEAYHTTLAMWQAGRREEAFNLFKSAMLDGMFMGASPGNIGQISYYDAARGECYRDFADPIGVISRAVVQGLFGFTPDALNRRATLTPGWPASWNHASITHPDFAIKYRRDSDTETYGINITMDNIDSLRLAITPQREIIKSITVNGEQAVWEIDSLSVGHPTVVVTTPAADTLSIVVHTDGRYIIKTHKVQAQSGEAFRPIQQGMMTWMAETARPSTLNANLVPAETYVEPIVSQTGAYTTVVLSALYNANVTDIFNNRYLSPRPPYTTLQIPSQGIGEWCHPELTASIDDSAMRNSGKVTLPEGITFTTPTNGQNIIYTTLWDNYPSDIEVPLQGRASGINLLMAGSTNHMQCYVPNAYIDIQYADGSSTRAELIPPYNWCPIEQAYYTDGKAFNIPTPSPYRVTLKDGVVSRNLPEALHLSGAEGHKIDGGAATILAIPTDPAKELESLRLTAVANDVVIGIMSITLTN